MTKELSYSGKGEKLAKLQSERCQVPQPTCSLKQVRRGACLSERVWGPDANYTKMILELLTDSLHFRATPYEGCLRGQMLRLLPRWNIFCVCLCRNSQLDARWTWNIRNVKTSADSLLNTITKNLSFCAALLSLLKAFLLTISGMILSSAPSISALMTTLKWVVEHWQTGAHFDITVM